jgi:hypothetical protein
MLILNKSTSPKKGVSLDNEIKDITNKNNNKVICKALNQRPVFLNRYLEASNNRKDKTRRKRLFQVAIELIKRATEDDITSKQKEQFGIGYSLKGLLLNGMILNVHIREESDNKDKRLFLISTFLDKIKKA